MAAFSVIEQSAIDDPRISRSAFGQKVKDNFDAHESRLSTVEARTADTATSPGGIGNQRLADRLGAGVGTGTNVTSGNASAQFADLRARASSLESGASSNGGHEREANAPLSFGTTETTVLYQAANDSAVGVSYSAGSGTFTFTRSGRWLVTANSSLSTVSANGIGYAQKVKLNGAAKATGISTAPTTGFGSSASTARRLRVAAGDTVTVTVVASAAGQALAGNASTNITLDYLGP